jgi:hypothetical protein
MTPLFIGKAAGLSLRQVFGESRRSGSCGRGFWSGRRICPADELADIHSYSLTVSLRVRQSAACFNVRALSIIPLITAGRAGSFVLIIYFILIILSGGVNLSLINDTWLPAVCNIFLYVVYWLSPRLRGL